MDGWYIVVNSLIFGLHRCVSCKLVLYYYNHISILVGYIVTNGRREMIVNQWYFCYYESFTHLYETLLNCSLTEFEDKLFNKPNGMIIENPFSFYYI